MRRATAVWYKNTLAGLGSTLICTFFFTHYCIDYIRHLAASVCVHATGHSEDSNLDIALCIILNSIPYASAHLLVQYGNESGD